MNPSSLLNVSSDLLKAHARLGMPSGPMAAENDRAWAVGVCLTLAAALTVLLVVLS